MRTSFYAELKVRTRVDVSTFSLLSKLLIYLEWLPSFFTKWWDKFLSSPISDMNVGSACDEMPDADMEMILRLRTEFIASQSSLVVESKSYLYWKIFMNKNELCQLFNFLHPILPDPRFSSFFFAPFCRLKAKSNNGSTERELNLVHCIVSFSILACRTLCYLPSPLLPRVYVPWHFTSFGTKPSMIIEREPKMKKKKKDGKNLSPLFSQKNMYKKKDFPSNLLGVLTF